VQQGALASDCSELAQIAQLQRSGWHLNTKGIKRNSSQTKGERSAMLTTVSCSERLDERAWTDSYRQGQYTWWRSGNRARPIKRLGTSLTLRQLVPASVDQYTLLVWDSARVPLVVVQLLVPRTRLVTDSRIPPPLTEWFDCPVFATIGGHHKDILCTPLLV